MTPTKTTARILVVDDEELVCDSMKRMLEACGYQVDTSPGSQEALARLEKDEFDLVIVDYFMPVMRGNELAARIRARQPGQRIMMISASAELLHTAGTPGVGTDLLIGKPILFEELGRRVAQALASPGPAQASRPQS